MCALFVLPLVTTWRAVRLVLDTIVFIDFLRGDNAARDVMMRVIPSLEAPDEGFFSVWTIAELMAKAGLTPAQQAQRLALTRELRPIAINQELMEAAALRASDFRNENPRSLLFDALIGISAEAVDAIVITRNTKDFQALGTRSEAY